MTKIPKVILFIESSRQYGRDLICGIAEYSLLHGPWTFYKEDAFYGRSGGKSRDFAWIKRWGADGIITRDYKEINRMMELGLPVIAAEQHQESVSGIIEVVVDHKQIGKLACEYFLRRGFKNFAFCGFKDLPWSIHRTENFTRILDEAGFSVNTFNSKSLRLLSWDKEYPQLVDWLKSLPKPVAILCCNDDRGCDVIEACKTTGLNVPFEVAVLGVDNDEQVCGLTNPPLSSIILSTKKAGFKAAETLDKLMSKQKVNVSAIIVEPLGIYSRQSTDSMAIDDQEVVKALQFINLNAKKLIQVNEVLDEVGCSRKRLDEKFRRILGHSVFCEIRRVRVENICNMLYKTNLSIFDIALNLGYNDTDHIARFFKQGKNMTLLQYRKTSSLHNNA